MSINKLLHSLIVHDGRKVFSGIGNCYLEENEFLPTGFDELQTTIRTLLEDY